MRYIYTIEMDREWFVWYNICQVDDRMENIEVKRMKNKRSIESLIEDSAIDSSFNQEAHELRKAFNETVLALNGKQAEK